MGFGRCTGTGAWYKISRTDLVPVHDTVAMHIKGRYESAVCSCTFLSSGIICLNDYGNDKEVVVKSNTENNVDYDDNDDGNIKMIIIIIMMVISLLLLLLLMIIIKIMMISVIVKLIILIEQLSFQQPLGCTTVF